MELYRRLADSRTLDDVENIREEIADRFGKLPQSATNLFDAAAVKISASILEIDKVAFKGTTAHLLFCEDRQLRRSEIESLRKATELPLEFSVIGIVRISVDLASVSVDQQLPTIRSILSQVV